MKMKKEKRIKNCPLQSENRNSEIIQEIDKIGKGKKRKKRKKKRKKKELKLKLNGIVGKLSCNSHTHTERQEGG
jgi:hypothetical protein